MSDGTLIRCHTLSNALLLKAVAYTNYSKETSYKSVNQCPMFVKMQIFSCTLKIILSYRIFSI